MSDRRKNGVGGNSARRNKRKRWLQRRARRNFLNPRVSLYRPRSTIARWGGIDKHTSSSVSPTGDGRHNVMLPEHLDFERDYDTTASHFNLIRDAARGRYKIKYLGFELIEEISPAAALVLASEVHMWNRRITGRLRAVHETWNPNIKRLLCEMGYFELLGLDRPSSPGPTGDVTFLNFRRGTSDPIDKGKLAKELRIDIEGLVGTGIKKHEFYQGLSEAIVNVGQHAYPEGTSYASRKYWWQSASFDRRDRTLTVMFYDQGIGIPNSLPATGFLERIRARFDRWPDSLKIKAAMKYGRSSTRRGERGKGLQDLVKFAKAYPGGRLSIYSGTGLYRIQHGADDTVETVRHDYKRSIGGTLIEWSVKL